MQLRHTVATVAAEVAGTILAGGASRRMGGVPKAFLPLADKLLIHHVLQTFGPQVAELSVSVHDHQEPFRRFGLPLVNDASSERIGPAGGLTAAIRWCVGLSRPRWLAIVPVDMPFLPPTVVAELVLEAKSSNAAAVSATSRGQLYPTVSVWSASVANEVLSLVDQQSVRSLHELLERAGGRRLEFADSEAFMNINTPEELKLAEHTLAHRMALEQGHLL